MSTAGYISALRVFTSLSIQKSLPILLCTKGISANYFGLLDPLPKANHLWHSEAAVMSPDTQVVLRLAFIRGQGCERFCTVSAVKVNDPTAANLAPYCCPIKVQDNDSFSDGNYELVLGAQTFVLTKTKGEYQAIVHEASPNNAASS